MVRYRSPFIAYDRISIRSIRRMAANLARFEGEHLKQSALAAFHRYHEIDPDKTPSNASIEKASLLQVPDAVALVRFAQDPLAVRGRPPSFAGQAQLIKARSRRKDMLIPVIYLSPRRHANTLQHEKIHICQLMQPAAYPLTDSQKRLYVAKPLDRGMHYLLQTAGREAAVDFITNAVCYKTWIEMEAHHETRRGPAPLDWMIGVYRSAVPLISLRFARRLVKWTDLELGQAVEKFYAFCDLMQREVAWVAEVVDRSTVPTLRELIYEAHELF